MEWRLEIIFIDVVWKKLVWNDWDKTAEGWSQGKKILYIFIIDLILRVEEDSFGNHLTLDSWKSLNVLITLKYGNFLQSLKVFVKRGVIDVSTHFSSSLKAVDFAVPYDRERLKCNLSPILDQFVAIWLFLYLISVEILRKEEWIKCLKKL